MTKQNPVCNVCGASVTLPENVEVSEIITCNDCHSRLVVKKIEADSVTLNEAPQVEEDWGQ